MHLLCRRLLGAGSLACLALLALTGRALAQPAKPASVRITTVDGVELHGQFYAGSKGKESPTVIMLHQLGKSSSQKGWSALARELQKKGFAVITFDFRGHGASQTVDPMVFWKVPQNALAGKSGKETIDFKNFRSEYYPTLINDIAAVKSYLDRTKNDNGDCNTASTILVGEQTGATLGAGWLNAEWHRYRLIPGVGMGGAVLDKRPEGKNVIACLWLSISNKLGKSSVTLSQVLALPAKEGGTAMVFMYGEKDKAGKSLAVSLEKNIKGKSKDKKYEFTGSSPIAGTTLKGAGLLLGGLKTQANIVEYFDTVATSRGNEWYDREFRKSVYFWRMSSASQPIIAKPSGVTNLNFQNYDRFAYGR